MATDKRHPSGPSQPGDSTGIPASISTEKRQDDKDRSDNYVDENDEIANGVRQGHPNRNEDKEPSTNIGGYRN